MIFAKFWIVMLITALVLHGLLDFDKDVAVIIAGMVAAFPALLDIAKYFGDDIAALATLSCMIALFLYYGKHRSKRGQK